MAFNYKEQAYWQMKEFTRQYQQVWTVPRDELVFPLQKTWEEVQRMPAQSEYEISYDLAIPPVVLDYKEIARIELSVQHHFERQLELAYAAAIYNVTIETVEKVDNMFNRIPENES